MSGKNELNYKEGPHVFVLGDEYQILYCEYSRDEWKDVWKYVNKEDDCILEVYNPAQEPFKVRIREHPYPNNSYFDPVDRALVISDIEGNFLSLHSILKTQGIINTSGDWIFGDGHLVLLGDLLDRGSDVTPCLWLLYKLEEEARLAGGRVHVLLGNHEIMVFEGDLRYLNQKYIRQGEDAGIPYDALFSSNTVIGKWLRQQPSMVRIGNIIFSHAGISPEVFSLGLSMDSINNLVRSVLTGQTGQFEDIVSLSNMSYLFGSKGIFWYRDWVESPPSEQIIDPILQYYQANHMVIGHTIVPEIKTIYGQKVIAIDLVQPANPEMGESRALLYEKGQFFEVTDRGNKKYLRL